MKTRPVVSAVTVLLAIGSMLAADASAQVYRYRDPATGKMILTDNPPSGVTPRPARRTGEESESEPKDSSEKPKATGVDPRLEARKREEDAQAKAKQEAEAEQLRERKRVFCADLARDVRALESGQRIVRMNNAGEREFLEDADRNRELEQRRAELARCNEE